MAANEDAARDFSEKSPISKRDEHGDAHMREKPDSKSVYGINYRLFDFVSQCRNECTLIWSSKHRRWPKMSLCLGVRHRCLPEKLPCSNCVSRALESIFFFRRKGLSHACAPSPSSRMIMRNDKKKSADSTSLEALVLESIVGDFDSVKFSRNPVCEQVLLERDKGNRRRCAMLE